MSGRDDNDTRRTCGPDSEFAGQFKGHQGGTRGSTSGRWPANLILDSEAAAMLDEMTGTVKGAVSNGRRGVQGIYEDGIGTAVQLPSYADSGGASRFFFRADYDESDVPDG